MAKFKPGQSGNPKGRPKKQRALTEILKRKSAKTIKVDGKLVSGKHLVATMLWEGLTTGYVTFPDRKLKLSPTDWKDMVKWMYAHVDGPPRQDIDVTSDGEKIALPVVYLPEVEEE